MHLLWFCYRLLLYVVDFMVTPGRLELPTRSLGNCCSIHLSYGAMFRINKLLQHIKIVWSQFVTL